MKKLLVPLAVLMLLALAAPAAFAQVELGMSWTPIKDPNALTPNTMQNIPGFHVGYGWFILYASWEALAMPNFFVQQAATYTDPSGATTPGPDFPGFLNLYDVGLRLILNPFVVYATVGTNNIRVYKNTQDFGYGANMRLGAGLKFGWWGVNVSGTNVYGSWNDLVAVLKGLGSDTTRNWSVQQITEGLVPSLNLTFYF